MLAFFCGQSYKSSDMPVNYIGGQQYFLNDERTIALLNEQRNLTRAMLNEELDSHINEFKSLLITNQTDFANIGQAGVKTGSVTSEKDREAYQIADHILDDVIANGGFDVGTAVAFMEKLNTLPVDQQVELRARHLDAANKGLISSSLTPEEVLMQGDLPHQK